MQTQEVLVRLKKLTKELNDNDVIDNGSCFLGTIDMYTGSTNGLNENRIIELWDNFIEDMKMLGIDCHVKSSKLNGNNNDRKK